MTESVPKKDIHGFDFTQAEIKALVYQKLTPEAKVQIQNACESVIDLLSDLNLAKWQKYMVVMTLFEEFPMEELV